VKSNETPETLLGRAINSAKLKRLAIILSFAGLLICVITLLPPVQNAFFSFIDANFSRGGFGFTFESRLRSLLTLPFFGLLVFIFALCCLFSETISAFLDNAKNARLITASAATAGALLLGFISIFTYQHGWQWLDSDHSSELLLGKLLAEENAFVSRNWYYSTELRLIYQTLFTMPLFKLLGRYENFALIRALGILFNNLALILSYLFMARQMKIQAKWAFITVLFLFLPLSLGYWDIVIFGGYYIFFIAQLFCCLGLYIRLASHGGTAKKALPCFILYTVLSFLLGIQGIRALLNIHIPLLIASVYLYSGDAKKKGVPLFLGCYGLFVCCVGFAANYLLHFWYSFFSFDHMRLDDLFARFFPKLGQSLASLAGFFGLSAGSTLLSAPGLLSFIAIIAAFLLFWAVLNSFRKFRNRDDTTGEPMKYQFMPVFFIVSVIFNIFVFIVLEWSVTDRYFIPFMVLYIPLAAILFQHAGKRYGHLRHTALISGIALFILGQSFLCFQTMAAGDVNTARQGQEQNLLDNRLRKGYIQYLLDNRLEYGFATYWNANITTELTNGKIELAGLTNDGLDPGTNTPFHVFKWLTQAKYLNPSYHEGESFLLLTRGEWKLAQTTGRSFARLPPDYEDGNFIILRYPSAAIIYSDVLDNL